MQGSLDKMFECAIHVITTFQYNETSRTARNARPWIRETVLEKTLREGTLVGHLGPHRQSRAAMRFRLSCSAYLVEAYLAEKITRGELDE